MQTHSMGGVMGGRGGTHPHTHTGMYTQMLHLPFSDLPLKKSLTRIVEAFFEPQHFIV